MTLYWEVLKLSKLVEVCTLQVFVIITLGVGKKYIDGVEINYCEKIWMSSYQEEFCMFALAGICLCIMSYIYIRIYLVVRKQQQRDLLHTHDLKKNKKALYTTLLVLGLSFWYNPFARFFFFFLSKSMCILGM